MRRLQHRLTREEGEDLILMCYMSNDFREGMDAFLNKRPPQWTRQPDAAPAQHYRRTRKRMGPLSGLKVVDLTHVMAGPTCTLMLADMGAEVIKIEKTPTGDDTRITVPPKIGDESAAFLMMNRNKRGIVLDLKTEGGAKVLRRLVKDADVLVENFGPGAMERLGFGYEDLRKDNPGLIYCSLSGFGRTGPYQDAKGLRPRRAGDERHHECSQATAPTAHRRNAARRFPISPPASWRRWAFLPPMRIG